MRTGGGTVKLNADDIVPLGVVTETGPVVAPTGTVALITKLLSTVKVAGVALNVTAVAPVKPLPTMVTLEPGRPILGNALLILPVFASAPVSNAPISQAGPCGRVTPRWSVAGGGQSGLPVSIAGLPSKSAWVKVGPPLFCSGPSLGSTLVRSVLESVQLPLFSTRLYPELFIVPL